VRDGKRLTLISRPLVYEHPLTAGAGSAVTPPALFIPSALTKFDQAAVLRPEIVSSMLDIVDKRSPVLKDAMIEARAGRYGAAAIEALTAGDQEAAAFLRGFDFLTKGQLDQAASQLQIAAGPRRQFFPAAFYLAPSSQVPAAIATRPGRGSWRSARAAPLDRVRTGRRCSNSRQRAGCGDRHPQAGVRSDADR
jgi:hypothetical protein